MTDHTERDRIIESALALAAERPWRDIALADISARAGMSLGELASHVSGKVDILKAFMRRTDQRLLASLERDPLEGDTHDRLFDVMLRRFELLAPYKQAIASIARAPDGGPSEWLEVLASALASQGWMLAAAGLESPGLRGDIHKLGLARVHAATLRVWVEDDDPGLARTMAALDRSLRDGEAILRRLETPIAFCASFARAFREFRAQRQRPPASSPHDAGK